LITHLNDDFVVTGYREKEKKELIFPVLFLFLKDKSRLANAGKFFEGKKKTLSADLNIIIIR
jgi:hypothetical protein